MLQSFAAIQELVGMLTEEPLSAMIISEVLQRWPQTAAVFHRHKMSCVGCAVAPFFTIADAATIYRIPIDGFAAELEQAINNHVPEA